MNEISRKSGKMSAALRDESPIDATSIDGLEHLLQSGDATLGDEMAPADQRDDVSLVSADRSSDLSLAPPDQAGDMWTIEDAINKLRITRRTIFRKLKTGELTGYKVPGPFGPEWRLYPHDQSDSIVAPGDRQPVTRLLDADHPVIAAVPVELIDELRKQITELKSEKHLLEKDLQAANWRNGYLESQSEIKDQEIKLLTDSQHKSGWWSHFSSWFVKSQ